MSGDRGVPTTAELVGALRALLADELPAELHGRLKFLTRVASNVAAQVERELELGPEYERAHAERLSAFGAESDAALASAIRDGALDDRVDELVVALRASAVERLRIVNPRHLVSGDHTPSPGPPG